MGRASQEIDNEYARKLATELLKRLRCVPVNSGFDLPKSEDEGSSVAARALNILLAENAAEITVMRNRHNWTLVRKALVQSFDAATARQLKEGKIAAEHNEEVLPETPYKVVQAKDAQGKALVDHNGDPIFREVFPFDEGFEEAVPAPIIPF